MRDKYPVTDAIQAALDCGADLVKLQFWRDEVMVSWRRGAAKGLEAWKLSTSDLRSLVGRFPGKLGISVFDPNDVGVLFESAAYGGDFRALAFIKTATQEYQYAALAEAVSRFSVSSGVPLYVSVPRDGCLVMGNYHSNQPITWLQCAPYYPASALQYSWEHQAEMALRLPGKFGLSDHTPASYLLKGWKGREFFARCCSVVEKHFCYNEDLRDKVPDGGPWSLSQAGFKKYAEVAHGT